MYVLMGKQNELGERAPWANFSNKIYECSEGWTSVTMPSMEAERINKGIFEKSCGGGFIFPNSIHDLGLWLELLMLSSPETEKIKNDPPVYKHIFKMGNKLPSGLTIETVKRNEVSVYKDMHVGRGNITMGKITEFEVSLMDGSFCPSTNAENGEKSPSSLTDKNKIETDIPLSITSFRVNDRIVEFNDAFFSINHFIEESKSSSEIIKQDAIFATWIDHPIKDINGDIVNNSPSSGDNSIELSIACSTTNNTHNCFEIEMPRARVTDLHPPDIIPEQTDRLLEFTQSDSKSIQDLRITIINNESAEQFLR